MHASLVGIGAWLVETLPAMLPNLHIRLSGTSTYLLEDGIEISSPRVALVGPMGSSYRMVFEPGLTMMIVGFLPAGWNRLVGIPSELATNRIIEGEALWGDGVVERLCEALALAPAVSARCAIVESFLLGKAGEHVRNDRSPAAAIDYWLENSPRLSLDELQGSLGVCSRQMRRLTLETHGLSPKTLAMKYRSLRAAAGLAVNGQEAVDDALALYADQAHLIRDFRRFVGWTPGAFVRERRSIAAETFIGRNRAGAARPLALLG